MCLYLEKEKRRVEALRASEENGIEKPGHDPRFSVFLAALAAPCPAFRIRAAVYMGIGKAPGNVSQGRRRYDSKTRAERIAAPVARIPANCAAAPAGVVK